MFPECDGKGIQRNNCAGVACTQSLDPRTYSGFAVQSPACGGDDTS